MKIFWRVMEAATWIVAVLLILGVDVGPDNTPRWGQLTMALLLLIALVAYQIRDELREFTGARDLAGPCEDCDCEDCNEKPAVVIHHDF